MQIVRAKTSSGLVEGTLSDEVATFKGIPFASPPIGEKRFSEPAAPRSWSGPLACTTFRAAAPQNTDANSSLIPGPAHDFAPGTGLSEDCLHLNIWMPKSADGTKSVLVWIHGGSFIKGSGTSPWVDGTVLAAEEDIIVVTINYRVGVLGSLSWAADGTPVGNNALRDQIAALKWVRDNIAEFGGDPDRVTIGGQSAGAISVCDLLGAPAAVGLFRAAISQSGHRSFTLSRAFSHDVHEAFLRELGLDTAVDWLARLHMIDIAQILAAQARVGATLPSPFGPVADGDILPGEVDEVITRTESAVPLLIGTVTDETSVFELRARKTPENDEELRRCVRNLFRNTPSENEISKLVASYRAGANSPRAAWSMLATDREWRLPVRDLAQSHAATGAAVFQYEFMPRTEILNGMLGACHGIDVPFVFGTLAAPGVSDLLGDDAEWTDKRDAISAACKQAWGAFVRNLKPMTTNLPDWPAYSAQSPLVMMIDTHSELVTDPHARRLDRLNELRMDMRPLLRDK